jgi:hypothetical protein
MSKRGSLFRFALAAVLLSSSLLLLPGGGASTALAQGFWGLLDPQAPLFSFPTLQGEFTVTPNWIAITGGKQTIPTQGIAWDLKEQFGLTQTNLFVDFMGRVQAGRISFRIHYEPRDFVGTKVDINDQQSRDAAARLSYTGVRLGGDLDVVQWYRSRAGLDMDYDQYSPVFSEAVRTLGGKQISGDAALTWGFHVFLNPPQDFYGVTGLFEARCRWPVSGTEVTDLKISWGLRSPDTILGSVALKAGYRRTNLEFTRSQLFNGMGVQTTVDATMSGWFGEIAYYY